MKTSNKLLLVAAMALIISFTSFVIYAKSNMDVVKYETITGNGDMETREFKADFTNTSFSLYHDWSYEFDPNSTGIVVSAESNLIERIILLDEERIRFQTKQGDGIMPTQPVNVIIGMKDKQSIDLKAWNGARITTKGKLNVVTADLSFDDHVNINMDLETQSMNLDADDASKVSITGSATVVNFSGGDNANTHMDGMTINSLNVSMYDNSRMWCDSLSIVNGKIKDNSRIDMNAKAGVENVITDDNAAVFINE